MGWCQCIKYYFQCHPDDGTDAGNVPGGRPCASSQRDPKSRRCDQCSSGRSGDRNKSPCKRLWNAIRATQEKMDRAYDGAAYAFGGTIEREPLQGYMPILHRGADKVMEESVKASGRYVPVLKAGRF